MSTPTLVQLALAGYFRAVRRSGLAIFSEADPVHLADLRTSIADWRELTRLRQDEDDDRLAARS